LPDLFPHGVEQAFMPAVKDGQTSASAAEVKNTEESYEVVSLCHPKPRENPKMYVVTTCRVREFSENH
jgi:hypothetical protein